VSTALAYSSVQHAMPLAVVTKRVVDSWAKPIVKSLESTPNMRSYVYQADSCCKAFLNSSKSTPPLRSLSTLSSCQFHICDHIHPNSVRIKYISKTKQQLTITHKKAMNVPTRKYRLHLRLASLELQPGAP
jgi:hypothetical protein